jgi:hypothetical protein
MDAKRGGGASSATYLGMRGAQRYAAPVNKVV